MACPLWRMQMSSSFIKLNVHTHLGSPPWTPDSVAEFGSGGEDSYALPWCLSLRNQLDTWLSPPILVDPCPAAETPNWQVGLGTSRPPESLSNRAKGQLAAVAALLGSSNSQESGHSEREHCSPCARLSAREGEPGQAPGGPSVSFGGAGFVSHVCVTAGRAMDQQLQLADWPPS